MTDVLPYLAAALPSLTVPSEWLQGGAVGLLGVAVAMILSGLLVPRRQVAAQLAALERDRDLWRDVALRALGQTDALLPGARISTEIARALSDAAQPSAAGDGTRFAP